MTVKLGLIASLALGLAACSSSPKPAPTSAPNPSPATPSPPVTVATAPAPQTPVPSEGPPPDQCGAYEMQALVGQPRTEIPVPVDPSRRRVYCTNCMVTQDYVPDRLDIVVDAQTGLITQVKCG